MRFFSFLIILVSFSNCHGPNRQEKKYKNESLSIQEAVLPDTSQILSGKALAQTYCQACHAYPDPGLLDKTTWKRKVLPQMALRLGLNPAGINPYLGKSTDEVYELMKAGIFPQKPYLPKKDWQRIEDFYVQQAPEKLALPAITELKSNTDNFSVIIPALHKGKQALTTLVKNEPDAKELWVGDLRNWVFRLDQSLKVIDSIRVDSPPVYITKSKTNYKLVTIGSIIPTDKGVGSIYQVSATAQPKLPQILFNKLHRPVNVVEADLNQDKLIDLVVCNYGYNFGALMWYRNLGNGKYEPIILKSLPGARKTEIIDLNHDGQLDIIALFAQGTETLKVFYNQGGGAFEEQNIVQFPPVYGTNYFELVDFNKDGHLDIMIVNGDNADYSFALKPYHGIRILLNNGQNKFQEQYFYQMPGAWKAIARDFDQDGDIDIAAISYFPDFESAPQRGFIYLEQTGKFKFIASTFAQSPIGHWFTMEAADYDQDGDEDIILGSFTNTLTPVPPALQQKWMTSSPSILILQNKRVLKPTISLR